MSRPIVGMREDWIVNYALYIMLPALRVPDVHY